MSGVVAEEVSISESGRMALITADEEELPDSKPAAAWEDDRMNYDGTTMTDITAKDGMEQPVTYWVPSIAPCGANFYTGDLFPKWKGHLFVASLAAEELRRLEVKEGKLVAQEIIFKNLGRLSFTF
jgi:glucose/arabinose dehydrogenase